MKKPGHVLLLLTFFLSTFIIFNFMYMLIMSCYKNPTPVAPPPFAGWTFKYSLLITTKAPIFIVVRWKCEKWELKIDKKLPVLKFQGPQNDYYRRSCSRKRICARSFIRRKKRKKTPLKKLALLKKQIPSSCCSCILSLALKFFLFFVQTPFQAFIHKTLQF